MSNIVRDYLAAALYELDREAKRLIGDITREEDILNLTQERLAKARTRLIQISSDKTDVRNAALQLEILDLEGND